MDIKSVIKSTPFYKYLYVPFRVKKGLNFKSERHELFVKEGMNALKCFCECMNKTNITYWLEFGTLLGVYRDNAFVPNELDLDIGAPLEYAHEVYKMLTENGFNLVREFHIVGERGLEQTYEYNGTTLDMMYFYKEDDYIYCTGAEFDFKSVTGKPIFAKATSHKFVPFETVSYSFNGINVFIPANTEAHLIEIFGEGFRVYDPNFKGDLNKTYYDLNEKKCIGFVKY